MTRRYGQRKRKGEDKRVRAQPALIVRNVDYYEPVLREQARPKPSTPRIAWQNRRKVAGEWL